MRPLIALAFGNGDDDAAELRRFARLTTRLLAGRDLASIVAVDHTQGTVIALIGGSRTLDGDFGRALAVDLVEALAAQGSAVNAGVGSHSAQGVRGLQRSLAEARLALDFSFLQSSVGGVSTYADSGSFRVLLASQSEEARSAFARVVLGPVLDQDLERGSELVSTLNAFLHGGGHWNQVAEQLHLHVNTLRYRIDRVEQLTGRSLSSFEERVNLYIALEALAGLSVGSELLENRPNGDI